MHSSQFCTGNVQVIIATSLHFFLKCKRKGSTVIHDQVYSKSYTSNMMGTVIVLKFSTECAHVFIESDTTCETAQFK